jgi:hypothetical protein
MLDIKVHQMDVKAMFLNGFLDEGTQKEQPDGFAVRGKEHLVRANSRRVCMDPNRHREFGIKPSQHSR